MAKVNRLLNTFSGMMKRDISRDNMPPDVLWNSVDFFAETMGAPLRRRGGWEYASLATSAATGTSTYLYSGIWAPFSAGNAVLVGDEDGTWFNVTASATTAMTSSTGLSRSPVFYDDAVYLPHFEGTAAPKKITGTAANSITAMSGSPPNGRYAVVYKDVLWLAAPSTSSDRIFFSTAGQPEDTWDTTNKWLDVSFPITGMAALNNAVFVFGYARTARIRGSVPPPDSDFIVDDPIFDVGCTDNRSIANYRDKVIWANAQGLYISDGSAMDDLTAICGMKNWWRDIMLGLDGFTTGTEYSPSSFVISGKVYRDYYIYSVTNGASAVDSGVIDLKRYTWSRVSNVDANFMFTQAYPEELYFCDRNATLLRSASNMFSAAVASSADADGTAITPLIETGFFGGADPALKTFRFAYLTADIRDPGSSNPYLTLSYIDSPEETSYTALTPTFTETTAISKVHFPLNLPAYGLGFKVAQSNASSDTRLYGFDIHAQGRESSR